MRLLGAFGKSGRPGGEGQQRHVGRRVGDESAASVSGREGVTRVLNEDLVGRDFTRRDTAGSRGDRTSDDDDLDVLEKLIPADGRLGRREKLRRREEEFR